MTSDGKSSQWPAWRVAVRADSSALIGHGHVMRCLALAVALRGRGLKVSFLHRASAGDASAAIVDAGFALHEVPVAADEAEDARACAGILQRGGGVDLLLVDHYQLGAAWVHRIGVAARHVLVIDDLASRPLAGDLLLDPNWHADPAGRYRSCWPRTDAGSMLLGTDHALLRPEFSAARARLQVRSGVVRRIVIAFGGGDPANATGACVDALHSAFPAIALDVVVGTGSPWGAELQSRWAGHAVVQVTVGAADMARRFAVADLFVGAGGSMTWERACLALPGVTLPIAANQEDGCARLAAAGEGIDLGRFDADALQRLVPALRSLLAMPPLLQTMSAALARRCDGQGSERVAEAALSLLQSDSAGSQQPKRTR